MITNPIEGLFKGMIVVVVFVFSLSIGIGIFIGKSIWDNGDFIESKKKITPMVKLTTDGKKIDTVYVYKIE